jgi:hypothetical protein
MRGCWVRGRKLCMAEQFVAQRAGPVVALNSGSHKTLRWRKADSNPRSLSRGSCLILA